MSDILGRLEVMGKRYLNKARMKDDEAENHRQAAADAHKVYHGEGIASIRDQAVEYELVRARQAAADALRCRRIAEYAARGFLYLDQATIANGGFFGADEDGQIWADARRLGLVVVQGSNEEELSEAAGVL